MQQHSIWCVRWQVAGAKYEPNNFRRSWNRATPSEWHHWLSGVWLGERFDISWNDWDGQILLVTSAPSPTKLREALTARGTAYHTPLAWLYTHTHTQSNHSPHQIKCTQTLVSLEKKQRAAGIIEWLQRKQHNWAKFRRTTALNQLWQGDVEKSSLGELSWMGVKAAPSGLFWSC